MNFQEMVLALLAIIFFTTVSLVYNRNMWTTAENLDNAARVIQATQLAHSRLDQIDARLFSKQQTFLGIKTTYNMNQTVTLAYPNYVFNLNYTTVDCDSLGVQVSPANNLWLRVTITVSSSPGLKVPVTLTRIYTKTNLNI